MQTLYDLYLQNPFWIWLAVGAVFVALNIATGSGKLIWPAAAAAFVAFVNLAKVRLGMPIEVTVFVGLSILGVVLSVVLSRRTPHIPREAAVERERRAPPPEAVPQTLDQPNPDHGGRLIGRIGRTTGEFVNGVGRVWIDGAEWGAEIDNGEEVLPPDAPVRVMGVTGGVRLKVRSLTD
jgi:membrane protein implicated in regulation of membrane protease activity